MAVLGSATVSASERTEWVLRVWVADRPGELARVATALGSAGADVVGIDIIERGGGRAIDELVVALDRRVDIATVADALSALPDVDVQDARRAGPRRSGRADLLVAAAGLFSEVDDPIARLAEEVLHSLRIDWVAVVGGPDGSIGATAGSPPDADWLRSFAAGVAAAPRPPADLEGILWCPADPGGLIAGRDGPEFVRSEQAELEGWAAVATVLLSQVGGAPVAGRRVRR